ncbi:FAD-dependent oxidoreductase [Acidianus brierleyi]|uniref:FAD-dependent oxidoreductase n=1 Tax=Acidianus brierleyi TaxID=41673 RepID=UPI001FE3E419|nr:FAD-dependent oxidoreductase [Acidianus brierleyi]
MLKIVIIGGGIAGSSLYIQLKKKHHEVFVIDPRIRKIFMTLIHSLLLKDSDVIIAKKSLDFYIENKIPLKEFKSITIGKIDAKLIDLWSQVGVKIEKDKIDWLNTEGIVAEHGDRLVYVKRMIDSIPIVKEKAFISQKGNNVEVLVNNKKIDADIFILASGPWNNLLFNVISKSYYCWASLVITRNKILDNIFIYDYEKEFYSRPFLGIGLKTAIVGDGKTIEAKPGTKINVNPLEVITKAQERLGNLRHIYTSGEFCEGTPDMRPAYGRLLDNLFYIGGFNGYGAEIGPGIASLLVDMIENGYENKEYLLDRFRGIKNFELGREAHEL